ncbi:hypothetical protein JCM21738_2948 [Mesobacillus boroniphilus JCM 21738]|uniref:Uncharacterized protein n=1 Tax=Mesobacillus boroniphilus JCM 21738 TaxID=1294265 RepID=W4RPP7_9BACI|nr:hypothetical protein JCM21738_2948 [Mesobacillus boroniphilus JCM 21738]
MSLTAKKNYKKAIRFIVAYQTISDYLDNLCDRSTSLDPADFSALHESMADALNPNRQLKNYYREREDQNDGGYLIELVTVCRQVLSELDYYQDIQHHLSELCDYYCHLQIHKHVEVKDRVPSCKDGLTATVTIFQKWSGMNSQLAPARRSGSFASYPTRFAMILNRNMPTAFAKDISLTYRAFTSCSIISSTRKKTAKAAI